MDVSPQTIRQVEFREKLRGYHQDDVDDFLERVAAGLEIMQERLRLATDRAVRAELSATESREDDDSLRKTLVLAQRTADLAVKEGREQAARILDAAEGEAATMRAEAAEESRRLLQDVQNEVRADVARLEGARRQLDQDVEGLIRYVNEQRARAKSVLIDAAAHLDAALAMPERPVLSDDEDDEVDDVDVDDDGDDEVDGAPPGGPGPSPAMLDRELLAEVIERGRGATDPPGWAGSQRPS